MSTTNTFGVLPLLRSVCLLTCISHAAALGNRGNIFSKRERDLQACNSWKKLGIDIVGEASEDRSGQSVSMSKDGSLVAIGSVYNDGNGESSGHVRVYGLDDTNNWQIRGQDIDGEAASDNKGYSVSMSDDGSVVAIGARYNDGNGSASGHVRVFNWNSDISLWDQRGQDIDGAESGDYFGTSVSMSDDGTVIAIGADGADGDDVNAFRIGDVHVYEWDSTTWVQRGGAIQGEANNDRSGISVSMSNDGTKLAIGANRNDNIRGTSGHVRIYEWDSTSDAWTQLGEDIDGEGQGDLSGASVSMSGDGALVAIGAIGNDQTGTNAGHVRIYEWDSPQSSWSQRGDDIDGEFARDNSGVSVSMSDDGTSVAIGAHKNDGNGNSSGHVRIYDWVEEDTGNLWSQRGYDIDGEEGNRSGEAVSISNDGNVVAIGATASNDNSGHVSVMEWVPCTSAPTRAPTPIPSFKPTPAPTPAPTSPVTIGGVAAISYTNASTYNGVGRKVIVAMLISIFGMML